MFYLRELAFELRRLQFSNRPVSSTESKNRLEQFFTQAMSSNDPSTAPPARDPAQFRSEVTRTEIEELSSRQRVSSILQSARQRLESTLQRFVDATASRPAPAPLLAVVSTPSMPPPPPLPVASLSLNQSASYTHGLHISQNSLASVPSNASSNIIVQSPNGSQNILQPVTAWVPVVAQPGTNASIPTAAPWLAQVNNNDALRQTIDEIRREQMIEEISELVHQQLVTSTLASEFRTRLEQRVMQHLQNSGTDGNRTRDFIRSINQTTRVERNDFSHLGINNQALDNLDSASTYQSSIHAQQQQQHHNTHMRHATASNTREIKSLKSEISELKSMMKLSFELQLDMQRSLRQEISALIAGTFKDVTSSSVINSDKNASVSDNQRVRVQNAFNSNKPSNEGNCVICTEGSVDTVLYKCGHMCTCYTCSMTLKQSGKNCPVCRAPIVDILRAYKCSM